MKMRLLRFDLPLRHVFTIARGSSSLYTTLVVELEQDGARGYGEAGQSDYYGASYEGMAGVLESLRSQIESHRLQDPAALWTELGPVLRDHRFAQCALDMAAHDLWGKLRGKPVWKLWGLSLDHCPLTDYTIGIDTIEVMLAKMREFGDWPIYKIKLGTPHDLQIVQTLRRHSDALFRVDANCAWKADEALRNATALATLGVELIEQPLPPGDGPGMAWLYPRSPLPLVADESCQTEPDVPRCRGSFHGVNVKLVKCGGLTPARRMLLHARQLGLKTMVGCMTETSVGISAIAQLLPMLDYVDMDGALLLAQDIASGAKIERGVVRFPEENGCGVRLLDAG